MTVTIGSLFSGYGGLDLGISSVIEDCELAFVSDIDRGANAVLAHHHPNVPNLGDISEVNWSEVGHVDILTGGFPCQDLSHAGKRAGLAGARSGLWYEMARAIDELRPNLVVAENVRGLLSAKSKLSEEVVTFGPRGGRKVGYSDRALGVVLSDLADLGYDARWYGLRAADVGAPHGRFRVFLFAVPADTDLTGLEGLADQAGAAQAGRHGHVESGAERPDLTLLPTPRTSDTNGAGAHSQGGVDLRTAVDLLQTPSVADGLGGHLSRSGDRGDELLLPGQAKQASEQGWGDYAPAIARWEALTRPAPAPTETGATGKPRLSPRFVEWMMGLPEGWVNVPTDAKARAKKAPRDRRKYAEDAISRNDQLKALGNGVVPQQAAAATRAFVHDSWGEV